LASKPDRRASTTGPEAFYKKGDAVMFDAFQIAATKALLRLRKDS